ncbi:MAG: hypothetical protein LLH30_19010 [Candidatus Manganitrophus sp. SA1]|nr:hypothetical protein [Candidatus Manganitrophus morganii]
MARQQAHVYRPTESKYKAGADEKYITYDLEQRTRGGGSALYPKVKRVYIAGEVKDWKVGHFHKKSGRRVWGVQITYQQAREGYMRGAYTAQRGKKAYRVKPTQVKPTVMTLKEIVEVPEGAESIRFHERSLPAKYQGALQNVK